MREDCREIDDPGGLIDGGRLYRGNLMLAQNLAHNVEPTRQWRVAKGLFRLSWFARADGGNERFFRVDEFALRLGESRGQGSNRGTRPLHGPSLRH